MNVHIGNTLVLLGSVFLFLGGLGVFRMPDVYNKLQAGTKATTLGLMSLALGIGVANPQWLLKSALMVVLVAFTNPVGSSVLARACYKAGIPVRKDDRNG